MQYTTRAGQVLEMLVWASYLPYVDCFRVGDGWEGGVDGGGLGGHGEEGGHPQRHPGRHSLPHKHSKIAWFSTTLLRRSRANFLGIDVSVPCYLWIEPEVDPGHDDQHAARDVDGDQVVGKLSLEYQVNRQAGVLAWVKPNWDL